MSPKPICILLLSRGRLTTGSWLDESNTTTTTEATRAADAPRACVCLSVSNARVTSGDAVSKAIAQLRLSATPATGDDCSEITKTHNDGGVNADVVAFLLFFCMHACLNAYMILRALSSCCRPVDVTALQFLSLIWQPKKKKKKAPQRSLDKGSMTGGSACECGRSSVFPHSSIQLTHTHSFLLTVGCCCFQLAEPTSDTGATGACIDWLEP